MSRPTEKETRAGLRVKYTVLKELAHGSFGAVYVIRDINDDRFALKVVRVVQSTRKVAFRAEVAVQRRLARAGATLPILDHWINETEQLAYMVMPLYTTSLKKHPQIPTELKRGLVKQLLITHQQQVQHTDIQSGNILLKINNEGVVTDAVLSDWGKAKTLRVGGVEEDIKDLDAVLKGFKVQKVYDELNPAPPAARQTRSGRRAKKPAASQAVDVDLT